MNKITLPLIKNSYYYISQNFNSTLYLTIAKRRKFFYKRLLSEIPIGEIFYFPFMHHFLTPGQRLQRQMEKLSYLCCFDRLGFGRCQ